MSTRPRVKRRKPPSTASDEWKMVAAVAAAPAKTCPRCKERPKSFNVSARVVQTTVRPVKAITSRSMTLCEKCALEIFEDVLSAMES